MSGSLRQSERVSTNLGALVDQLHDAVAREERATDLEERYRAELARVEAEHVLAAGLMSLGVRPFDARAMVRAVSE